MALIETKYGPMEEALLSYREEITDNDNEYTVAQVWERDGEIVKRSAHITLKQMPPMGGAAGSIG